MAPAKGMAAKLVNPARNGVPLGNVMIIQEASSSCSPDDEGGGGIITLTFADAAEATVNFFELLDIEGDENNAGLLVEFFNSLGAKVGEATAYGFGNNSYEEFRLNIADVNKIVITLPEAAQCPALS